jgi:integrase
MGYLYRPKYKDRHGQIRESAVFWCQYYASGKPVRESTGETLETKAKKFLQRQEGKIAEGRPVTVNADRIKFSELTKAVEDDYQLNGKKTLKDLQDRLRLHILPVFGHRRATSITAGDIRQYTRQRMSEERKTKSGKLMRVANATINRELAIIKRAYKLAIKDGLLYHMPGISMLEENNVRKGFFEPEQVQAVLRHLPEDVQAVSKFGNITGWRKAECLHLKWDGGVDFNGGSVRVEESKNGDAQEFPLTEELRALLENQWMRRCEIQQKTGTVDPCVFIWFRGKRAGRRMKSFRGSWETACEAAGLPDKLFHDFRRTSVRRSARTAGLHQKLAMSLSGHKTDSVFRRYDIISKGDLSMAAAALNNAARIEVASVADKDTDKDGLRKDAAATLTD